MESKGNIENMVLYLEKCSKTKIKMAKLKDHIISVCINVLILPIKRDNPLLDHEVKFNYILFTGIHQKQRNSEGVQ